MDARTAGSRSVRFDFFIFSDDRRRHAWIGGACPHREAKWQPLKHMRVCSAHFVSSNKCDDPMDVDWAPSVIRIRSQGIEVGQLNKERHERAKRRASSPALHAPPSKQPSSNISSCSQCEPSKVPNRTAPSAKRHQQQLMNCRQKLSPCVKEGPCLSTSAST